MTVSGSPLRDSGQCATPGSLAETLRDLFDCWQSQAQESQEVMDGLERELAAGISTRDRFDTGWYYWRGRRDGYESAAYELRQQFGL